MILFLWRVCSQWSVAYVPAKWLWALLKFGIEDVRAYHRTYFLFSHLFSGWRKFWALFHIWNASWLPKSIKCGRKQQLWMNYSCVFQVLASDLGSSGNSRAGEGWKSLYPPSSSQQWLLRIFIHLGSFGEKTIFVVLRAVNWIHL